MDDMMNEMSEETIEIPKLKNLANCTPREFFKQTNKIRKAAKDWLDLTNILEIRKRLPTLTGNETPEDKKEAMEAQAKKNLSDMLDAALDANVDETVTLLGYLCFVEPEDVDNYPVSSYLGAFSEIIGCSEVIGFFTSLMQLAQTDGSGTAKA